MASAEALRIAMWSGPRNISTALMRSWSSRDDTFVCDEPFYAHYLAETGLDHPGAEEVIAHHETDWRKVMAWLTGPVPEGKAIFYQKQMTHHMLPAIELDAMASMRHVVLIREPRRVLASLVKFIPTPTFSDTGVGQQSAIWEWARGLGPACPVVDTADLLRDPPAMLQALCAALEVEFQQAMLSWPPGLRSTDGIWAKHWYAEVEKTTGFAPYQEKQVELSPEAQALLPECQAVYEQLHAQRLRV